MTGSVNTKQTPLVCHHLESWDQNFNLRFSISNGVVLEKKIHKKCHDLYGFGKNTIDQFEQFCFEHYKIVVFPWNYGNHEPSFIKNHVKKNLLTVQQKQESNIKQLALSRGHEFVTGSYEMVHSNVTIFCLKHKLTTHTTYHNYKRSKFGCHCCAREKQSQAVSKANRFRKKKNKYTF